MFVDPSLFVPFLIKLELCREYQHAETEIGMTEHSSIQKMTVTRRNVSTVMTIEVAERDQLVSVSFLSVNATNDYNS